MTTTKTNARHLLNGQTIEITRMWWGTVEEGNRPRIACSKTAKKWRYTTEVKSAEQIEGSRRWAIDTTDGLITADISERITVVG